MRTKISTALIVVLAIFLGGCAAPQKKVVTQKPVIKEIAPRKTTKVSDLDSKLTDLTNQIVNSLTETRRSRIAIIEFSDLDGNITEFGKYLSEELITRLFMTRKFEVVERQFLNKVIREHKLTYTHFFDEKSVKDIGKLLGVDAIASGSVTDLGDSVKVNARLIATDTGSIFAVAAVEIYKDERVARMIARKAKTPYQEEIIVTKPRETPSPIKPKPVKKAFTGPRVIITDDSWKTFESEFPNWKAAEFDDSYWIKPVISMKRSGLPGMEDSKAKWIWFPDGAEDIPRFFRKVFYLKGKTFIGKVRISADDKATVFVNEEEVCEAEYGQAAYCDISSYLRPGKNVLAVQAVDTGGPEGLMIELKIFAHE
jgi:TolB-like protein